MWNRSEYVDGRLGYETSIIYFVTFDNENVIPYMEIEGKNRSERTCY